MQGKDWGNLLRRIPANFHDDLILATTTGAEIVLQSILRIEPDFIILRGRPSGSSDAGKIIIVPFQQVSYVSFKRALTEPEVAAIFGEFDRNFAALPESLARSNGKPADDQRGRQPAEVQPAANMPADDPNGKNGSKASKSILLARIRERLNNDSSKPHR
jgi:hypothetical protein